MKETSKGLYEFWTSFDIPAYVESSVPDDAELPYITYELRKPSWRGYTSYVVRVWYRDTSFDAISEKVGEISDAIGEGKRLKVDGGFIWLFKDDNFAQLQPTEQEDTNLKVAYLSMVIHVLA